MTDDWTVLRRCNWLHEAEFIKSVLDGCGIKASIPDEHTLGVNPGYTAAFGGVRVLVRSEDVQRASDVLESVAGQPDQARQPDQD